MGQYDILKPNCINNSIVYTLNISIKMCRLLNWTFKKQDPAVYCLKEMYIKYKDTDKLKVKLGRNT